jgi:ribosomal protein S18 acetylase RimI-like enzyme
MLGYRLSQTPNTHITVYPPSGFSLSPHKDIQVKIRRATLEDVPHIARMNTTVQQLHHQLEPTRYKAPNPDDPALHAHFAALLGREDVLIYIAEVDGQAAGYVICFVQVSPDNPFLHPFTRLHIDQLSVDAAHQRRGIGRELMDVAREAAQQHNATEITLGVHAENTAAIAFYAALGFTSYHLRLREMI